MREQVCPQDRTLGGLHTAAQRGYNPQNRSRGRGRGGGVRCGCPGEGRGRGRCVTSEEVRLDRPASELADCGRPHASRGAALLERGGPLRGRGRCWGDRDCRYGSISVCPAVRRGVGLRGEAARRVEAVSDGGEGEGGSRVGLARVRVAPSGGIGRGGAAPWMLGRCV